MSDRTRYDALVVGGGPGGSTAAYELARRGLSVLLLDRAAFPRDKPCGGGVTVRAAGYLPFDLASVTERTVTATVFSLRGRGHFRRTSSTPLVHLTQRRNLDTMLLEHARSAGATIREGTLVREVEARSDGVTVRAADGAFTGKALVVADGAHSRTLRQVGLDSGRWMTVALEGNLAPPGGVPTRWRDAFGFDLGGVPSGYGWLFPKGDHVNVGVWGWTNAGPDLRRHLHELTRAYGFDPAQLRGVRGHHIPLRQPGAPLVAGTALAVGDAAGLGDPFTGEGIHAAIVSGQLAAATIAAYAAGERADLRSYGHHIARVLLPELCHSHHFAELFHLSPALQVTLMRHWGPMWHLFTQLIRGEETYGARIRRLGAAGRTIGPVCDWIRKTPLVQHYAGNATDIGLRARLREVA